MLSRTPSCSSPSTSLPTCAVGMLANPANTSISRRWNGRSGSGMLSHDASVSGRGVSFVSRGNPAELLLAGEDALAVPVPAVVELALCTCRPTPGRCGAGRGRPPGAQYIRNGLSGGEGLVPS